MFESARAYSILPASDLERAVRYWKDTFDLDPVMTDETGVLFEIGGSRVLVYETQFAGTAKNTAFGIDTDDLESAMSELRSRGVEFADYDMPGLKTVDGVADLGGERSAWFTDSEGNILAIGQRT
ncbi:catechol 2,3-dioxygenase-like lactoylglutathione lyase family enzyme [Agromyces hippuratus]|uniref:Catechol 2,3-dioxygenase-like lactoylglutathione lyase family enzyme n=1 Tax=Agromyces hippuratus TaxID=286438 RepID=A0A852WP31_9MICO|nr:VOC family protein [Agromyces hippuratus]NYG19318.1 catechol 2,3-dioxygenase-like lactoylglutathione lyase family enzyme [Agromyces hippuratus]